MYRYILKNVVTDANWGIMAYFYETNLHSKNSQFGNFNFFSPFPAAGVYFTRSQEQDELYKFQYKFFNTCRYFTLELVDIEQMLNEVEIRDVYKF